MGFDFSGVEIPQVVDSTHVLGRRLTDSGGRSAELGWIGGAELHRWHHRRDYVDAQVNFGEFWLVWDWAFGTRFDQPTPLGPEDVGLDETRFPASYVGQLRWPFSQTAETGGASPT